MNLKKPLNIERQCPICRGNLTPISVDSNEAEIPVSSFLLLLWWVMSEKYPIEYLPKSKEILSSIEEIFNSSCFDKLFESINIKCEKCGYIWNLFDETDLMLHTNDNQLIQKYISFIESIIELYNSKSQEQGLSDQSIKELLWGLYLIIVKLYHYCDCNNQIKAVSHNYDYSNLCIESFAHAKTLHTNNPDLLSLEYEVRADMSNDIMERFKLMNAALISGISTHRKTKIQNNIDKIYSAVLDRWNQPISIDKRRIIFIANNLDDIAGFYDYTNSINHFFTIDRIPVSIKFPYGPPTGNELYIANPAKPNEYVPYGNYEPLFMDKIRELKRLLRSLGATEITFTSLRGTKIEEAERDGYNVTAGAGYNNHNVSGGYSSDNCQNRMSSQGIKVDYIERLNSNEYPSLPDGLHWYNSDPEWKDIVEARLHHNQLHFEQSISTKQVTSLNEQSQMNVNAAYEGLICKINANYHREREFHVKTTEETMWRITAEFKPLSEFESNDKAATKSQQNLSSNEQKYLDLVKKVSAGGMISELNRKMLEQIRIKLNISEEKAKDLEASLIPQLSEDEKKYIEAVREYLAEGTIGENERVLLQTLRELNNISEERASELEAMA